MDCLSRCQCNPVLFQSMFPLVGALRQTKEDFDSYKQRFDDTRVSLVAVGDDDSGCRTLL